jgi:PAS domain S-box-containing protein
MVLSREITARIKEVLEKHPEGLSITDLVKSVDINRNTAGRYLENLLLSGQVEMRRFGMAKLYTLTKRLPVSSVLSLSSELVMQLDSGQRIFYANEPLLAFLGVPAKDLFGKNIEYTPFTVVFEDVFPELLDRFRRGLKGEEWRGELSRPVRGRFFLCRIAPSVSNEGTKGVSVLLEDISDQKRDEERIRKSEARLRSIFKASPVGIGVVAGRVLLEVNDRLCQMTGYPGGELIGKPVRILYPSQDEFDKVGTLVYEQVQQRGTGSIETQWKRKDGRIIDILLNITPLDLASVSGGFTFTAFDITERNQAGRALRESEDRYRTLAEASQDFIFVIDRHDRVEYVNSYAAAILGLPVDQVIGKKRSSLFPGELGQRQAEGLRRVFKTGKAGHSEGAMEIFGNLHWFDHYLMPITDTHGTVTSVLGVSRDINDRKGVETALQKSDERYRSVFENTGAATAIVEENTIISLVNDEFERLSGYTKREIEKKKSWTEFVVKEDLEPMLAQHYLRRESRGALRRYEFRFIRKGGEIRNILLTVDLIPGTKQTVTSLLDITDRKLADEKLLQREQQYRFIADNSLDIITRQTPEFICTYVSPAINSLLGYSEMEVLGKSTLSFVHPDDLGIIQRNMIVIAQNGSGHLTVSFRIRHKNGHYLSFESTIKVICDEKTGKVKEYLCISRDITARKFVGENTCGD